jgi:cytochrome b
MKIRIWDLPTRLFHWALVLAVLGSFISADDDGGVLEWHARFGYFILSLLLFRVIWGFAGSHYARFFNFIKSPKVVLSYLKNPTEVPGHNPLGALSVVTLLGFLLLQAVTGLFASDDIAFEGPLAKYISSSLVELLTSVHRLNQSVLIAVVALHIGAILYYRWMKKTDLIKPMVTGDKEWAEKIPVARDGFLLRLIALVIYLTVAGVLYYFLR